MTFELLYFSLLTILNLSSFGYTWKSNQNIWKQLNEIQNNEIKHLKMELAQLQSIGGQDRGANS